jgi:lysophospholipase L1-like esterase
VSARELKSRRFLILSAIYIFITVACLGYASHLHNVSEELHAARRAGLSIEYATAVSANRAAGFCEAGAVLATAFYVLCLGVFFAPSILRLISGNLLFLLCFLLLIELGTRLVGVHFPAIGRPGIAGDFGLWVHDATKGWFHAPSTKAESFFGGPDRGEVRINELGLRGREIELDSSEMTRVLVFGDSYVFGVGVDEEHLLTTHLERLLQPHFPPRLEAVNMGVSGYSTDQELLLMKELGPRLRPKIVILVICDNDYRANSENFAWRRYYKPYFDIDDEGGLHLRNVPVPQLTRIQRAKLWLGQESNVWNFVRGRESENPTVRSIVEKFAVDVSRPPRRPYKTTRAIVKAFADEAERLGAWFLVTSTGRRGENPDLFESLSRFLKEEQIHYLDLLPRLQAARDLEPNRLWDFGHDTHWNRDAHELVARRIFEYIQEHYPQN